MYTETISSIISETFNKLYFAPPTLRVVFTSSTLTIKKKIQVEYFFKNYIHAEFHQNRQRMSTFLLQALLRLLFPKFLNTPKPELRPSFPDRKTRRWTRCGRIVTSWTIHAIPSILVVIARFVPSHNRFSLTLWHAAPDPILPTIYVSRNVILSIRDSSTISQILEPGIRKEEATAANSATLGNDETSMPRNTWLRMRASCGVRTPQDPTGSDSTAPLWFNTEPLICALYLLSGPRGIGRARSKIHCGYSLWIIRRGWSAGRKTIFRPGWTGNRLSAGTPG